MGLQPARTKFRRVHLRYLHGRAATGTDIAFGEFGLQVAETGYLTTNQIESARKAITHYLKRGGKVWVKVCADLPYTSKPAETRMGGGKGAPAGFTAAVRPGHILFEIAGIPEVDAKKAFRLAAFKLPIKVRMVKV